MLRIAKLAALVSAVVLSSGITTLLFVQASVPASALLGPPSCVDGDVNGDTQVDVADPVYLLNYLFGQGPNPVACAQTTPADVEAAVDSVLARYIPRAGDRVFEIFNVLPGETQEIVAVPAGRVFVLEMVTFGGGLLEPVFKINGGAQQDGAQNSPRPPLPFFAGENIVLNNSTGSMPATLSIWGYWLDDTL